jgi:hypothetical protein
MTPWSRWPHAAPRLAGLAVLALAGFVAGCDPGARDLSMRLWTEDMEIRVLSDPQPPRARELGGNRFRIVVRDRETREPIEGGEGNLFATSRDGVDAYAPLEKGEELGTYYATLHFITSGEWAMGLLFRRDSTKRLERLDWMQEVFPSNVGSTSDSKSG